MITLETFIKDLENTRDNMISDLAVLNGKREQLLNDIAKLNSLINEVKKEEE